jgi:hypothetical protein
MFQGAPLGSSIHAGQQSLPLMLMVISVGMLTSFARQARPGDQRSQLVPGGTVIRAGRKSSVSKKERTTRTRARRRPVAGERPFE